MSVLPTKICTNNDLPPEVEVRFDFQKKNVIKDDCNNERNMMENLFSQNMKIENENFKENITEINFEEYNNWQLKFVHNQLFENLKNSNRFCPGVSRNYVFLFFILFYFYFYFVNKILVCTAFLFNFFF